MESFQFTKSSDKISGCYDFSSDVLDIIPYPDDSCMDDSNTLPEDIELPPPPGAQDNELIVSFNFQNSSLSLNCKPSFISQSPNNLEGIDILRPEYSDKTLPPLPSVPENKFSYQTFTENEDDDKKFIDDSRYSPSKIVSDDENQDFATSKPKVLGKEQAKKRLLAFSLSKQPSSAVKKQNKITSSAKGNKEKPPNPNKSSGVQEQFRATITAIEEEKKKMMQNMPNYLLKEMGDLTKFNHPMLKNTVHHSENRNSANEYKSKDFPKKRSRKSRSRSESRSRSRSKSRRSSSKSISRSRSGSKSFRRSRSRSMRRKRSRNRSRSRKRSRSLSKNKHRSQEMNRRSKSRDRKEEKKEKSYDSEKRISPSFPKKEVPGDWKSFKAAGLVLDNDFKAIKEKIDASTFQNSPQSPKSRLDFKPIFNYLKPYNKIMVPLQVKAADQGSAIPLLFSEKTIKYTKALPMIVWTENPAHATDFYMPKQMLLENCDEASADIIQSIIENKKQHNVVEDKPLKSRSWYPHQNLKIFSQTPELFEDHKIMKKFYEKENECLEKEIPFEERCFVVLKKDSNVDVIEKQRRERHFSLVNDSYLSDEERDVKEVVVGDVKVQLDKSMNCVKVRSKWDSDYEDNNEKELINRKEEDMDISISEEEVEQPKISPDFNTELNVESNLNQESKLHASLSLSTQLPTVETEKTGNLVSEYEEFLKMVSFNSNDSKVIQGQVLFSETHIPVNKQEIESRNISKMNATNWDEESDNEGKLRSKKIIYTKGECTDELLLPKEDRSKIKKKKVKNNDSPKKKIEKKREKKKKSKQLNKSKKKKYGNSSSSDSSSESSSSSTSSSDSNESKIKKKKKKKKIAKNKKNSKKDSSSDSDSSTDDSDSREKKSKKKKNGKKQRKTSTDSEGEKENVLLKHLDFKKHLIIKKLEEIDCISEKSGKKKDKENRQTKKDKEIESTESLEKFIKPEKRKKDDKIEKGKKNSKSISKKSSSGKKDLKRSVSSSESESESSEDEIQKKSKKIIKKKRESSETDDSKDKCNKKNTLTSIKNSKAKKNEKKNKKAKKEKRKNISSSSDSESDNSSPKNKRKIKKKKNKNAVDVKMNIEESGRCSWKENFSLAEEEYKNNKRSFAWRGKKPWKRVEKKIKSSKKEDDWEASSSFEESNTTESSWNDEAPYKKAKLETTKEPPVKDEIKTEKMTVVLENEIVEKKAEPEPVHETYTDTLKNSFSNFSFNENSFCSFGQELSRDFFLTERSFSNSSRLPGISKNEENIIVESRPFQSVSASNETKKPTESERYSPGYSDSELSNEEAETAMKSEKTNSIFNTFSAAKEEIYDPLNCDTDGSIEDNEVELSKIPLPENFEVLGSKETRNFQNVGASESKILKELTQKDFQKCVTSNDFLGISSIGFTPVTDIHTFLETEKSTPKKQVISVKAHQRLVPKAASVFQDESDDENYEWSEKAKVQSVKADVLFSKNNLSEAEGDKAREKSEEKMNEDSKKDKRDIDRSREKSREKERYRMKRSSSRDRSPRKKRSRTPEVRHKKEIKSDSFEIEPLKNSKNLDDEEESIQQIPVLTGHGITLIDKTWSARQLPGYIYHDFSDASENLIENAESFDIYPSEDAKPRNVGNADRNQNGKTKKEMWRSCSRSLSPKNRRKSKSPEKRNRSPRRRSISPRRRDGSSYSPRRRSPRRKSPRRYKGSRSPERRRKSRSRSPRKRRKSPLRRSRSSSPKKHRSPRRRDSPRKRGSPQRKPTSPRKDSHYSHTYPETFQNRIPVIGASCEGDLKRNISSVHSPKFESAMNFSGHLPESTLPEPESVFYGREYDEEFGVANYPEEGANLITVKGHTIEKTNSPERLSLDQRIELELGVQISSCRASSTDQYPLPNQSCSSFQEQNHFQNSYGCENSATDENFYQNPEFNGHYFNNHQHPPNYNSFQQYSNTQPVQSSVLQVGNIVEVVPAMQHPTLISPSSATIPPKPHQVMQVGNVLQVVPSQKVPQPVPVPSPVPNAYGTPTPPSSLIKTQKATAVVAPSSVIPNPNPEAVISPLIKAIQLEREKRQKEKEKRKAEREARRKARQLKREAKLMSVNEKLKKSVQDEGLMLGQEVEDDELLDGSDLPSPPIPVEVITVSSDGALPPAGKGILITAGFMPKPPSEKKEVKFADGVCPGEGTSESGGEEIASPPPKVKLPKEKRFKKKKMKVKKKVKVQIIRQIIQDEEDDEDDDLSPPPPPPGSPPPVFFARFPFAGDAQFPVYQTQTTTTTLTTVQYPAQAFQ